MASRSVIHKKSIDYSDFITSIRNEDSDELTRMIKDIMPRLIDYLVVTMRADYKNAEECAHQAFLQVYDRVKSGLLSDHVNIFGYLLVTTKNEYLTFIKKEYREGRAEYNDDSLVEPAQQINYLLDEEKQKILMSCLDELDKKSRDFIEFYFREPDAQYTRVSKVFNLSLSNVRTRKSRILNALHRCFRRKSDR